MFFNSWTFLIFLAVVLTVYYALSHRAQNIFLILASYVFYGWWDWRFLSLILISTLIDFTVAPRIERCDEPRRRKALLLISLFSNLGILGFFKYFNFFADSMTVLLESVGIQANPFSLSVILPVGISFYTFQTLAYTIDVYRGRQKATDDFFSFALYVCYFPQLVAGPIERAQNLLPAIQCKRIVDKDQIYGGIQLMLLGFVKKMAIADAVAPYVNEVFASPTSFKSLDVLMGAYLFALQIYGDFSGYSDIARGVSKLMGIDLMLNFRQPYLALNVQDFWRRWHISLSAWLRDYLYIPLGGNRHGEVKTYRNLMLTMLLGGLWHGAAWTFVFWGFLHGAYLAVHRRVFGKDQRPRDHAVLWRERPIRTLVSVLVTFHLVCIAWIFFRAPDFATAAACFQTILSPASFGCLRESLILTTVFYILFVLALDIPMYRNEREALMTSDTHWIKRAVIYAGLILAISFLGASDAQPFIYFQF